MEGLNGYLLLLRRLVHANAARCARHSRRSEHVSSFPAHEWRRWPTCACTCTHVHVHVHVHAHVTCACTCHMCMHMCAALALALALSHSGARRVRNHSAVSTYFSRKRLRVRCGVARSVGSIVGLGGWRCACARVGYVSLSHGLTEHRRTTMCDALVKPSLV